LPEGHSEYDSVYGRITTDWRALAKGRIEFDAVIPPNATARVILPNTANTKLTENGKPVRSQVAKGNRTIRVGSGSYRFEIK
jgi:alpha-L-rhamnosidase